MMTSLVIVSALLGAGIGLPVGVPPGVEDPVLASVAPQECLWYASWTGVGTAQADSDNATERLLAEKQLKELFATLERELVASGKRAARSPERQQMLDDLVDHFKMIVERPSAVLVERFKPALHGSTISAGIVVQLGDDAKQTQARIERMLQSTASGQREETIEIGGTTWHVRVVSDVPFPVVTGFHDGYFILGFGKESIEGILKRWKQPPPAWLTELRKQLPVERLSSVGYANLAALAKLAEPALADKTVRAIVEETGILNLKAVAGVSGYADGGFVTRQMLMLDGPAKGVFALADAAPLTADDLKDVPANATFAFVGRLNLLELSKRIKAAWKRVDPQGYAELEELQRSSEKEAGFGEDEDLWASLGDVWRVYNTPDAGGWLPINTTLVADVRDAKKLREVLPKLHRYLGLMMADKVEERVPFVVKEFEHAGGRISMVVGRREILPVAPSWCITDSRFVFSMYPQGVKEYLSRPADTKSLAEVGEVAAALKSGRPVAIGYVNERDVAEKVYPVLQIAAQFLTSDLQREDIRLDMSAFPSANAILPHLAGGVTTLERTDAGILLVQRGNLPSGNLAATGPVTVALMLPAIQAARTAARRAASMANLRNIAIAVHNHAATHGDRFPPPVSLSKEGKPLLSWRVQILPFIEQQALFDKFQHDEPWDSEHNKKLIAQMPEIYLSPNSALARETGKTHYVVPRGKDTVFEGPEGVAEIPDGMSNTLLMVETGDDEAVIWTMPDDWQFDPKTPHQGLGTLYGDVFLAALCDVSVRALPKSIDAETLRRLVLRNDRKVIPDDVLGR